MLTANIFLRIPKEGWIAFEQLRLLTLRNRRFWWLIHKPYVARKPLLTRPSLLLHRRILCLLNRLEDRLLFTLSRWFRRHRYGIPGLTLKEDRLLFICGL